MSFLHAELDTGLTFASVASKARYEDKMTRNRASARKAYDATVIYMGRVAISDTEAAEIQEKLNQLKRELQQLGEAF